MTIEKAQAKNNDTPDLNHPLSHYFGITEVEAVLHGVPILGIPGGISIPRRSILRGAPAHEMAGLLREFVARHAIGGLSHVRILRSPHWRRQQRMLVLATDVAHVSKAHHLCTLPWWSDAECETWAMQAFV
jgi:hypothetical protein